MGWWPCVKRAIVVNNTSSTAVGNSHDLKNAVAIRSFVDFISNQA